MAFKIVGTIGYRHMGDKGWMAYVPIMMGSDEYFLVLVDDDISLPGHVLLHLKGKEDWKPVGTYAIPDDHKYMHLYRELQRAQKTAIATGMARESEKLYVPLILTKSGIVPYQKRTEE